MSCVLEALANIGGKNSVQPPKPTTSRAEEKEKISPETVKLTRYASGLGCACKMKAPALMEVLHSVKKSQVPPENLLVGYDKADDASVYKVNDDVAVVNTTDFFPPIVDNPRDYGRIAAANALSDVYAMGGKPITALSVSIFPTDRLPLCIMTEILQGAEEVAAEAGTVICGGHTLDISELIFGLAVTGVVNPKEFKTNGSTSVKDGDVLILTKPIGTGIVTTLLKKEKIAKTDAGVSDVIKSMSTLNKYASEILCGKTNNAYVHALTDVTGYGLSGHLSELVRASSVVNAETGAAEDVIIANVNIDKLKIFPASIEGLKKYGAIGVPGGSIGNTAYAGGQADESVRDECSLRCCMKSNRPDLDLIKCLVVDPQTSGGLLAAVDREQAPRILNELVEAHIEAAIIGEVRRISEKSVCGSFAHSRYVVFSDNDTKEDFISTLDNSMNTFDIMAYLAKQLGGSGSTTNSNANVNTGAATTSATSVGGVDPVMATGATHTSTTIFIRNTTIGSGDPVLGKKLLLAHLGRLSQRENMGTIKRIVFMNTGVRIPLGLEDPRYTTILQTLESKGLDICACGTCVDHYAYSQASLVRGRGSSADENLNLMSSPTENCMTLC